MIDHALLPKIATDNAHHSLAKRVSPVSLLIKTLALQRVYETSSEWLKSLQFVGAIDVH